MGAAPGPSTGGPRRRALITGAADSRAEKGSGNTPRNGPGSIATVAFARARSALAYPSDFQAWMTEIGL
jgi:hypothetical protein